MESMMVIVMALVVVTANVMGASMTLPQVRHIFKTGQVAGVSSIWAGAGLAGNTWWLVYGLGVGNMAILPVSLLSVIAYCAIGCGLYRFGSVAQPARGFVLGMLSAVVPLPFALAWGWSAAGLALGLLYGVQLLPAVIEVYRRTDLSGVSGATWTMACVEAALWATYAWPQRDIGVLALGGVGVALSALVLTRLVRWRGGVRGALAFNPAA